MPNPDFFPVPKPQTPEALSSIRRKVKPWSEDAKLLEDGMEGVDEFETRRGTEVTDLIDLARQAKLTTPRFVNLIESAFYSEGRNGMTPDEARDRAVALNGYLTKIAQTVPSR